MLAEPVAKMQHVMKILIGHTNYNKLVNNMG